MVMADIGPIMVDIIHPIMVVMVMVVMVVMVVRVMAARVIPPLCTSKKRTVRKLLQNHSPTIGIIAATQRAIIPMSKSVQTAGCRLPRGQLHQLHRKEYSCLK